MAQQSTVTQEIVLDNSIIDQMMIREICSQLKEINELLELGNVLCDPDYVCLKCQFKNGNLTHS